MRTIRLAGLSAIVALNVFLASCGGEPQEPQLDAGDVDVANDAVPHDVPVEDVPSDSDAPSPPTAPFWPDDAYLHAIPQGPSSVRLEWSPAEDDSQITVYEFFQDGEKVGQTHGQDFSFRVEDLDPYSTYTFAVAARDDLNNQTSTRVETSIRLTVPDPADVAPERNPTVFETNFDRNRHLFDGEDPIQRDVAPGTIEERRISVFRGRVLDRQGDPLEAVHVSIHGHPEYGYTLTRPDGRFDLAVNGGGRLTVVYKKGEYITSHRTLPTDWQKNAFVANVVLVEKSSTTSMVDLSQQTQVARGTEITDDRGTRRGTAIFRDGTVAEMVLPDGSKQELPSLTLRYTEFTVGEEGPQAMPATLPPSTAYTYAGEFTVDEAQAAGAKRVEFSRPVAFYVDDFRDIPVGSGIPLGYYDRERAVWVPEENGLVIEILGVDSNGLAQIDVAGDGTPATSQQLADLDFTDGELRKLAQEYASGDVLWRSLLPHFSSWDCNWGVGCDGNLGACVGPEIQASQHGEDPNPDCVDGSVIGCQSQTLSESVSLTGTPFRLVYDSEAQYGYAAQRSGRLRLFDEDTEPRGLMGRDVALHIDGRCFGVSQVAGQPGLYEYQWDGLDGQDNPVYGAMPATVVMSYSYVLTYSGGSFGSIPNGTPVRTFSVSTFGLPNCTAWGGSRGTSTATSGGIGYFFIFNEVEIEVHAASAPQRRLGGWSLDVHHSFDPTSETLFRGDGTNRNIKKLRESVRTIAGKTQNDRNDIVDGVVATDVQLDDPQGLDSAPDGSVYFTDARADVVYQIDPDGKIHLVAGLPYESGYAGDGRLAVYARLDRPTDVAVAPNGDIYIADERNHRIRRIDQRGIIETFAGSHVEDGVNGGFDDDDRKPALEAKFSSPSGIDIGPDGALYVADSGNHRIRRIGPDGMIETIAGASQPDQYGRINGGFGGDGGPSRQGVLDTPTGVGVGVDGSVYVADSKNRRIRRISNTGIISTVAGTGRQPQEFEQWGDALKIDLKNPKTITVAQNGDVFFSEEPTNRSNAPIRRLRDGNLTTVVMGEAGGSYNGDGTLAHETNLTSVDGLAIGPDGNLLLSDRHEALVRRVQPVTHRLDSGKFMVASRDGSRVYVFDEDGRHLRTLNALTQATLLEFGYDDEALLTTVTDGDGLVTTIERDTDGHPEAIVGPYGHRTELSTHQNGLRAGFLQSITSPDGATYRFDYYDPENPDDTHCSANGSNCQGLLKSLTEPKGGVHRYEYDRAGRLTLDEGPEGFRKTLVRTYSDDGVNFSVDVTTRKASGSSGDETYVSNYSWEVGNHGETTRSTTHPSGHKTVRTGKNDSHSTVTNPNGMQGTVRTTADPRFGPHSPVVDSMSMTTPSGLTHTVSTQRNITLADGDDLLSLETLTTLVTVGGHTFESVFDAATRTYTTTSPEYRTSTTTVDELGRVIKSEIPGLYPVTYVYDADGRLESVTQAAPDGSESRTSSYEYFAHSGGPNPDLRAGLLKSQTGPTGLTTTFDYDILARTSSQTVPSTPGATSEDARQIAFEYDANGNLISLTPPGRSPHQFGVDQANLDDYYWPPKLASAEADDAYETDYEFGADHRLEKVTHPDGDVIDFVYETGLDRLDYVDIGGETHDLGYDAQTGQLTMVDLQQNQQSTQTVGYEWDGPLLTKTSWTGDVAGTIERTYDDQFRVASRTVTGASNSHALDVTYTPDGLFDAVGQLSLDYFSTHGLLETSTLGRTRASYTYTGFGEADTYTVTDTTQSTALFDVDYTYDALGRIDTLIETTGGQTRNLKYRYDQRGRLIEVLERNQQSGAYDTIELYGYDTNGNRTSVDNAFDTLAASDIAVDAQDRLTTYGGLQFTYTDAGELLTKTDSVSGEVTIYDYDALGNLRTVTLPDGSQIVYLVDGAHRRIGRKVFAPQGSLADEQYWLYKDSLNPVAELDGQGRLTKRFVYASKAHSPDSMVEFDPATGAEVATYRIVSDHLGSVRMVVDVSTGDVVQSMSYDTWGNVLEDTNQSFQPFGFAGGLYDARTELVRFGARDYDPRVGRWTAKDPIGFGGGESNLYAYAGHSPVNYIDPTGKVIFIPVLVGAAVGAAIDIAIQLTFKDCIDWGQVGISAAAGALGGGLAAAGARAVTGHLIARNIALREAGAFASGSYYASRVAPAARVAHAAVGVGAGAVTGAAHQGTQNAYEGRPLSSGVAQAAFTSGLTGGHGSRAGLAARNGALTRGASGTAESAVGAAARSGVANSAGIAGVLDGFFDQ